MKAQNTTGTHQTSLTDEDSTCARCGGLVHCESWCELVNGCVRYAHDVVLHPAHLSFGDRITLHALGAQWDAADTPNQKPEDRL